MRLLGLDPGLRVTGWGVIEAQNDRLHHIANGTVRSRNGNDLASRLSELFRGLTDVISVHAPDAAAVEETFVNTNRSSALRLGQARGVVLLAPALAGLPVTEYAANLVKKSLTGAGHADKTQVAAMVAHLLPEAAIDTLDAADALAVAICHAHHAETRRRWRAAS